MSQVEADSDGEAFLRNRALVLIATSQGGVKLSLTGNRSDANSALETSRGQF